jgi:hypothetical protein
MASLPSMQLRPSQARRTGWRGRPAAGFLLLRDFAPSILQHQISQFQHSAAAGCAAAIAVPTAAQWVERKAARRYRNVGKLLLTRLVCVSVFSSIVPPLTPCVGFRISGASKP